MAAAPTVADVRVGHARLPGLVRLPDDPRGLVVFVHGSGSSRHSPRNAAVADALAGAGYASLLFDLLQPSEAEQRVLVFDIERLAARLLDAIDGCTRVAGLAGLRIGLFGASTGGAAALVVAAHRPLDIGAVVVRGGRPDLAGSTLAEVRAPTLLIVGSADHEVLALNRAAFAKLGCEKELAIVPGATHLFEEPGAMTQVTALATAWFDAHLAERARQPDR